MTALQFPPVRLALRHPAVRAALLLLLAGPPWVAWLGKEADAPIRLRLLGLAIVGAAALAWDDRVHALTASTPVGLPAVRRGRVVVVGVLLTAAFGLGLLAVPEGVAPPTEALVLQTCALTALLYAVVAWVGRDGSSVLAVPLPALLLSLAVLFRMPKPLTFLQALPGTSAWPAERARWIVLMLVTAAVATVLSRDPAARGLRALLSR